ncbi:enoyl-CoA hydratase/isomerase family protein [Neobacillus piezotolerans]|uniref:Enoyl-CoA hydratase/isomerase family protein n=1 Tax=Neobacillus piezotolerans TaxID=2259171 RepID=A0A3D8GW85_9BACI|nr:enoyl-CoA hydratase/isomerase family protein [Neobacillus piezotolerans]RDU38469.1 enoyl-CoA hydratase/isomerase family protein [Neobacillus piezotolerans]
MAYSIKQLNGGILLFTIEREEKRNAINYEIMEGLTRLMDEARGEAIKAIALTGTGDRAFCSGGDLGEFHSLKTKEEALPMLSRMAGILHGLLTFPKPTVAVFNGTAVGGGCELAAACDFRIAKSGIKAGFIQGRQGITTGWGGGSILSEKFPGPFAMRLLMEAEPLPAEELAEAGFIDKIFENNPEEAAGEFLSKMVRHETGVLVGYKRVWTAKWEAAKLWDRMKKEVDFCSGLWESEAHNRQVAAFLKRG